MPSDSPAPIDVLYVLPRTDLASMNPGKAIAQGVHAGNHAVHLLSNDPKWRDRLAAWETQTAQHFGTVITLDAGGIDRIRQIVEIARQHGYPAGLVHDPEYPLVDGAVVHLLPLDTCGWVFAGQGEIDWLLGTHPLHP
ncbi:hypothetical protein CKO28_01435 [Rhodovibrio sodomensis]|uniref:peptidyl-tRNA hydrolase n=1 Tax=Rhodovibrio sodomensis TaxID=1088 RepID=A0ABS1D9A0_9PROT|nr:peptidyl-tRNA hydrolase [Rhodovibrio sodomensis]MBK1666707.1 hypothetical protein [Rhodovibrio sodomensis]